MCLCVCPVRALTFESLDLETSFLVWMYIFRISRPSSYVKVIGSMSRSHELKNRIYKRSQVVRLRLEGKLVTTRKAAGTTFGRVGQSVCASVLFVL